MARIVSSARTKGCARQGATGSGGHAPRGRRACLTAGFLLAGSAAKQARASEFASSSSMALLNREGAFTLSDKEWKARLSDGEYNILRKASTERPFTSPLNNEKRTGTFVCAGCEAPLFESGTKYNSGTGWPSFYAAIDGAVDEVPDFSIFFMPRTEVRCHRCQGHLGHVFDDGPKPTGLRYCMNGLALGFAPRSEA